MREHSQRHLEGSRLKGVSRLNQAMGQGEREEERWRGGRREPRKRMGTKREHVIKMEKLYRNLKLGEGVPEPRLERFGKGWVRSSSGRS